jgi:hypothetical protein
VLTPSVLPKTSLGAQNMKQESTPSVPSKMFPGAQNMKIKVDALVTAQNESESAKHENESRSPR